jgi:outer membrane protein OmpA-like peptidoglycan-associated protein
VGYGDSRPAATGNTAEARAKNRRVEFIVVEQ